METNYYWYDHDNKLHAASVGGLDVDDLRFTLHNVGTNLEPGKTWKVKVYLADDYYADYEWRDYNFYFVTDTVPEIVPEIEIGDANRDGKISIADARLMLVTIANGGKIDDDLLAITDMNGDGNLTIADARQLLVKIANGEV